MRSMTSSGVAFFAAPFEPAGGARGSGGSLASPMGEAGLLSALGEEYGKGGGGVSSEGWGGLGGRTTGEGASPGMMDKAETVWERRVAVGGGGACCRGDGENLVGAEGR